jgi:hypothetical protein
MKRYYPRYEKFYTGERMAGHCRLPKVNNKMGLSTESYRLFYRRLAQKYQRQTFDFIVKFYWLGLQFKYIGRERLTGTQVDRAYGIFMRKYVGIDNRLYTHVGLHQKILSYIKIWYPNLAELNPFTKKINYPYRYMTFECLMVVAAMQEKLELLDRGEKNRMNYARFLDYILNYVYCHNEDVGWQEYVYCFNHRDICSVPLVAVKKK